jgi:peptide/nickel transport system substrate-binding protein
MRKLFFLLSLLVVASMLLSACGGAATPAATEPPATGGEEPAPPTEAPATEEPAAGFTSKDPTSFVTVSFGEPNSLDPAYDYETAGSDVLGNTTEPLVFFDGNWETKFVPGLAESWEVSADGKTYTFQIRSGVKFHDGADLTPSDIAFSFQRGLLQGGTNSPQFLLFEPFFGIGTIDIAEAVEVAETAGLEALADGISQEELGAIPGALYDDVEAMQAKDPALLAGVCEAVKSRIVADDAAGTVTMNLSTAFGPFIPAIAQPWGSALDQDWVAANGGWDGSCDTWQNWYAIGPETNPLNAIVNGTGPFVFDHWTPGEEIVLVRNDNYWREPAKLERVVIQQVDEWSTRFAMAQAGDADQVTVPVENRSQMDELVGETCNWDPVAYDYACEVTDDSKPLRLTLGKPGLTRSDAFFNFNVANPDGSNTFLGSGELDGNGIPADFFADVHVRKAFNYCFDWDTYIGDIFNGEAIQSRSLAIPGMPGYNETDPVYTFDPAKCEEEFKLADVDKDGIPAGEDPEGDVWTTGFRMQGTYNQGNTTRQTIAELLSLNLNTVNELFILETVGLPWPAYLRSIQAHLAPIFFVGWQEDYHDPHNWYVPYLVTTYAARQSIPAEIKSTFTPLINEGVQLTEPDARNEVYKKLNQAVYDNPPGIIMAIGTSHGFLPRYVKGVVYNSLYGNLYYYPMYEE